jgi:hypothetical protein
MIDRNLARGLFLAAIALAFGLGALRYPIGDFSRAGAGLFPLMMSCLLLLIAVATLVRSRLMKNGPPFEFNPVNIALLLSSLCAFALVSRVLNMTAGIVAMVFISGVAGTAKYSIVRNLKVSVGLFLVALAFQKLLGLGLNLY